MELDQTAQGDAQALVGRLIAEVLNQGRVEVLEDLLPPDSAHLERMRSLLLLYRSALPDLRLEIQEQVVGQDVVVTRFLAQGTQQGALLGIPPTGRTLAVQGVLFSRVKEGRIASHWALVDLLGALQQLSVMPELSLEQAVVAARMHQAGIAWQEYEVTGEGGDGDGILTSHER